MCDCITNINEQLDDQVLETGIMISRDLRHMFARTYTPLMRRGTEKRDNRRSKPSQVAHKFCPFCGEAYADPTPAVAA